MENNPFGFNSAESPNERADKTDKPNAKSKKKTGAGESSATLKKQKAEDRIAKSIDALSLLERPTSKTDGADKEKETNVPEDEAPLDQIGDQESRYIEQAVARERLAELADADQETQEQLTLAADFLERVSNGQEVDEAYAEVAAENGIDPAELAEAEAVLPDSSEQSDQEATEINDDEPVNLRPNPPTAAAATQPTARTSAPGTVTANLLPNAANTYYQYRHNHAGSALLGGVVGYLIGRRRGRIKTEKKLAPVQKKLEKQVHSLAQNIEVKERQLVALQSRKEATPTLPRAERLQPSRVETRLHAQKPARAEQLGHMIVAAEAPTKVVERMKQPGNIREAFRAEDVKTMDRTRMLELSEKIVVEGASLRHIYESNLIGERQLRHLVSEHLQGHDIRDELRRHMVEREIDYERDPIMRDRIRSRMAATGGGTGIGKLLKDAGLATEVTDTNLLRQIEKQEQQLQADKQRQHRQRVAADTAMATAIVVLAVAVMILAWRG